VTKDRPLFSFVSLWLINDRQGLDIFRLDNLRNSRLCPEIDKQNRTGEHQVNEEIPIMKNIESNPKK
jgi:hypothetical protein